MNVLDIGIILIFILIIMHGAYRGLVRQIFSVTAIITGIILAGRFYSLLGRLLKPLVPEPLLADIIGGAVIFVGVTVALILIGGMLHQAIRNSELAGANRVAGAAFGGLKGVVIILIGIGIMTILIKGHSPVMRSSFIVPRAVSVIQKVTPIFPHELRRALDTRLKTFNKEFKLFKGEPYPKKSGRKGRV